MALECEVVGKRKKGRQKTRGRSRLRKKLKKVMSREDEVCPSTWIVGSNRIATRLRRIQPLILFLFLLDL